MMAVHLVTSLCIQDNEDKEFYCQQLKRIEGYFVVVLVFHF